MRGLQYALNTHLRITGVYFVPKKHGTKHDFLGSHKNVHFKITQTSARDIPQTASENMV